MSFNILITLDYDFSRIQPAPVQTFRHISYSVNFCFGQLEFGHYHHYPNLILLRKAENHKAKISKGQKLHKVENRLGRKYDQSHKRFKSRSRSTLSGPPAPVFRTYFLFYTIIGLFECEKGYLCFLFLKV